GTQMRMTKSASERLKGDGPLDSSMGQSVDDWADFFIARLKRHTDDPRILNVIDEAGRFIRTYPHRVGKFPLPGE
ncbi:MAG: hypothetical protein AAFV29_12795, partial [Myxococcota bacterium]